MGNPDCSVCPFPFHLQVFKANGPGPKSDAIKGKEFARNSKDKLIKAHSHVHCILVVSPMRFCAACIDGLSMLEHAGWVND